MQSLLSRVRTLPMLLGFVALSALAPIQAATISTFTFTGTCTDCSGQGKATLVLQDYTQGNAITLLNLVSFTYLGTNLLEGFTILQGDNPIIDGIIPAGLPGPADFSIFSTLGLSLVGGGSGPTGEDVPGFDLVISPFFNTSIDNRDNDGLPFNWEAGDNGLQADFGTSGTWNAQLDSGVPEPSSVILIGAGLLAIGFRRFKR